MLHVVGENSLTFAILTNFVPEATNRLKEKTKIGSVPDNRVQDVTDALRQLDQPTLPDHLRPDAGDVIHLPDCQDWARNAVFALKTLDYVELNDSADVPDAPFNVILTRSDVPPECFHPTDNSGD